MQSGSAKSQSTRSRRRRCLTLITIGLLLKTLIILTLIITFIRIRSPKVRFRSVTVQILIANSTTFHIRLNSQLTVKNPNFGKFKFSNSSVAILHRGSVIGRSTVPKASVSAKSTKKVNIAIEAAARSDGILKKDLKAGKVRLYVQAMLNGRVHLLKVVKRKKSGTLNCTMDLNVQTRAVERLDCL